jgi:hypothetical protein
MSNGTPQQPNRDAPPNSVALIVLSGVVGLAVTAPLFVAVALPRNAILRPLAREIADAGGNERLRVVRTEPEHPGDPYFLFECAKDILQNADQIELLSLDPREGGGEHEVKDVKDLFHDYRSLGSVKVTNGHDRKRLVAEIDSAIAATHPGEEGACFEPRHGIRATAKGRTVTLVICFQCWNVHVYLNDALIQNVATKSSPEEFLDRLLKDAGVPLAPKKLLRN